MENNTSTTQRHAVIFHGRAGEYFSIWLVNALLTFITLGIYSAWATVRRRRYFYGNTEIAGDRFDYHARPIDILKGRIIVFVGLLLFFIFTSAFPETSMLFMLVFLALIPWVVIRSWRYNALMSSFRGVRFNYHCRIGRAYWVMFLAPLLMVVGLYLVVSLIALGGMSIGSLGTGTVVVAVLCAVLLLGGLAAVQGIWAAMKHDLYINNMAYGQLPFSAALNKKPFIKMGVFSLLITLPFLIIAGMLISSLVSSLFSLAATKEDDLQLLHYLIEDNTLNLFFAYITVILGGMVSSVYLFVAQRNYALTQTRLGEKLRLKSTLSVGYFMILALTNSLIVIFTLGFGTPIAEVRLARYLAAGTALEGDISLLEVTAHQDTAGTAVAEEVVAAFDINVGI